MRVRLSPSVLINLWVADLDKSISVTNISDCVREIDIIISGEEFRQIYNSSLAKLQKEAKISGFRPGKVPTNVLQKMYGPSIKLESEEKAANKYLKEFIENGNINIVGTPALIDIKENEDGSHAYKIRFEVIPDFDLKDYQSLEIDEPVHRVSEDDIEEQLAVIAKSFGQQQNLEQVTDYDVNVVIDSYRLDKNTQEVLPGKPEQDISLELSRLSSEWKQLFLNTKIGDELIHTPAEVENIDTFSEKILIKGIVKTIPHAIDDELAQKASNNKFDNIEDFKQEIGFQLQNHWDEQSRKLMEEQVVNKLVALHNDLQIPEALLSVARDQMKANFKEHHQLSDKDLENEETKRHIDHYSRLIVIKELVIDKIIEKEKLEVEDFDIEMFVDKLLPSMPQEFADTMSKDVFTKHIRDDERAMQSLLNKKFMDFILDFATTNEVDFADFNKTYNNDAIPFNDMGEHDHDHNDCCHDENCDCEK